MKRRKSITRSLLVAATILKIGAVAGILLSGCAAFAAEGTAPAAPAAIAPIKAPFPMPQLKRPTFPDKTFDIRDYGAVECKPQNDEQNMSTEAIAKAIKACNKAGGGKVLIPKGYWLSGAIHLKSNVNLHVADGAVVHFPSRPELYLPVVHDRLMGVECYNYSPFVYAPNVENIAITGKGTLQAQGDWWWDWAGKHQYGAKQGDPREVASKQPLETRRYGKGAGVEGLRPSFIVPWKAKNVLIEGITLRNIPLWAVRAVYTENIIIRDITVHGVAGRHGLEKVSHNNAGVCIDSCRNVLVEYVHIETTDDAVVVRSGLNEDGLKINIPSENIVVRNYVASDIDTGSGGIVFGSETSGGIRNVYVHNARFERADRGIRFKSTRGRGNVVENIYIENIRMKDIHEEAIIFNTSYPGGFVGGAPPQFRNIFISDVECDIAATAISMTGLPEKWLENFRFKDVKITNADNGAFLNRAKNITFENVTIQASKGPAMTIDNCKNVTLKNATLQGKDVALSVKGSETSKIKAKGLDSKDVICAKDVPSRTVTVSDTKLP